MPPVSADDDRPTTTGRSHTAAGGRSRLLYTRGPTSAASASTAPATPPEGRTAASDVANCSARFLAQVSSFPHHPASATAGRGWHGVSRLCPTSTAASATAPRGVNKCTAAEGGTGSATSGRRQQRRLPPLFQVRSIPRYLFQVRSALKVLARAFATANRCKSGSTASETADRGWHGV